jgi:hypothetical protein
MRGTKPHKSVWVCYLTIPHANGHQERYISGVFASQESGVRLTREWLDPNHGDPRVTPDGHDTYLVWPSGNRARINRYQVQV